MATAAAWQVIWACLGLIRQRWPVQLSLLHAVGGMTARCRGRAGSISMQAGARRVASDAVGIACQGNCILVFL